MATTNLPTDLNVQGNLTVQGTLPSYPRASLVQDDFASYGVGLTSLRVHDAFGTALGTASADDLGIGSGTFGTGAPYVTAGDLKAAGATTRYARFLFQLPVEYVAGQSVRIMARAGMLTTAADTSCTLDAEAHKLDGDTTVSSDLVTTAATSMNSGTFADVTFDVTATTLTPGDWLDVRLAIACNDAATGTAVEPALDHVAVELDVKG
ncbi:MAG: hypothetical protein ACYS26_21230 [Planctomycetota bacterium]|jgi:hypothetical protein